MQIESNWHYYEATTGLCAVYVPMFHATMGLVWIWRKSHRIKIQRFQQIGERLSKVSVLDYPGRGQMAYILRAEINPSNCTPEI